MSLLSVSYCSGDVCQFCLSPFLNLWSPLLFFYPSLCLTLHPSFFNLCFYIFVSLFFCFLHCVPFLFDLSSSIFSIIVPYFPPQLLLFSSSSAFFISFPPLSVCPPLSFPPLLPLVSWFLLALSRQQLLSPPSSRSFCSLWWSGRSIGRGARSSAVAQDPSLSPGHVRLISGLSGLVLGGGKRAARGVWVVDARCSVGGARVEGALLLCGTVFFKQCITFLNIFPEKSNWLLVERRHFIVWILFMQNVQPHLLSACSG